MAIGLPCRPPIQRRATPGPPAPHPTRDPTRDPAGAPPARGHSVLETNTLRFDTSASVKELLNLLEWFPEQLHGVSESYRRLLDAMNKEVFVPMSIVGSSCIDSVRYDYDLETGRRILAEVSLKVTQADRETLSGFPMIACLFDILNGRLPNLSMSLRPTELEKMIVEFVEVCRA